MEKYARKTKIVCTIGPATNAPERLSALISAGMNVARLNFSHGDREEHRATIRVLRGLARDLGHEVGILQDLGGPKIRLGVLPAERVLAPGETVTLAPIEAATPDDLPVGYPWLAEDVTVGERILLADGMVELHVTAKEGARIRCEVTAGGAVSSHKGVNLPATNLRIPAFTEKDRADLAVGLEEGVDFVALSFVRTEADVAPVREILSGLARPPLLIAKIEKPQAVERLEAFLPVIDGVMVARGDLGVEMPLEEVPMVQKRIIEWARTAGKPVITATQMLRSMVESPRPSRAEAADVANAILDGTDAVMLSEETAVGAYPVEAVEVLDRVARATEPYIRERAFLEEPAQGLLPATSAAISRAACWMADDIGAVCIVASTSSGSTARLVSRFRPCAPVIGLTQHKETERQLSLSWGVFPMLVPPHDETDEMFERVRVAALASGRAKPGDRIIITAGVPAGIPGKTNLLKVLELE